MQPASAIAMDIRAVENHRQVVKIRIVGSKFGWASAGPEHHGAVSMRANHDAVGNHVSIPNQITGVFIFCKLLKINSLA
jgi:hypothetical protein